MSQRPIHEVEVRINNLMDARVEGPNLLMTLTPTQAQALKDLAENALHDLRKLGPCQARTRFGEQCQRQMFHDGKHTITSPADGRSLSWEEVES